MSSLVDVLNQIIYRLTWSVCLTFTAKLGIVNSQFYRFLRLCSSSAVFSDNWSCCALKNKGYPLNNLLKEDQRFARDVSFLNFSSDFSDWFCIESFTWRAVSSPLGFCSSSPLLCAIFCSLFLMCLLFSFLFFPSWVKGVSQSWLSLPVALRLSTETQYTGCWLHGLYPLLGADEMSKLW